MEQLTATCYKCNKDYAPTLKQVKAWLARPSGDFDETNWLCGLCQLAEINAVETCPWRIPDDPWSQDNGQWETGCGNAHEFFVDGPKENGYRFCPYCKKPIEEVHKEEVHKIEHSNTWCKRPRPASPIKAEVTS